MFPSIAKPAPDIQSAIEVDVPVDDCSSAAIRAELHRVLASPQFEVSDRNKRFLEYVTEETLAGKADRIKGYNIATEVFGRDVNFDPQLDPVVRMEARRLRRALERFYLTDVKGSSTRIAMPKGGYVPTFRSVRTLGATDAVAAEPEVSQALRGHGASIAVARFDAEGDESIFARFNHGFSDQIMVGLFRYPHLSVFGSGATARNGRPDGAEPRLRTADIDYIVTGSTALFAGALNVKAVLVRADTGRVLWGRTFEEKLEPGLILGIRDDIANTIVRELAEPFGVIFNEKATTSEDKRPIELPAEDYSIGFHHYRRSYSRALFPNLRNALERAAIANPRDDEALSYLSLIYSDAHRFGFAARESPSALRNGAAKFAEQAVELNPNSALAHHAKGVALWFLEDVPASFKALDVAMGLNPNATEIMADLGLFRILVGDESAGGPLLDEACARKPLQTRSHHIGCSLNHFFNGRYQSALDEALEVRAPDVCHGFVAQAISYAHLGRGTEAAAAVARIVALAPSRSNGPLTELAGGNLSPVLANKLAATLCDAGLPRELAGL